MWQHSWMSTPYRWMLSHSIDSPITIRLWSVWGGMETLPATTLIFLPVIAWTVPVAFLKSIRGAATGELETV